MCEKAHCECGFVDFIGVGGDDGIFELQAGLHLILEGMRNTSAACKCGAIIVVVKKAIDRVKILHTLIGDIGRGEAAFCELTPEDYMELQFGLDLLVKHTYEVVEGKERGCSTILSEALGEYRKKLWVLKKALGNIEKGGVK